MERGAGEEGELGGGGYGRRGAGGRSYLGAQDEGAELHATLDVEVSKDDELDSIWGQRGMSGLRKSQRKEEHLAGRVSCHLQGHTGRECRGSTETARLTTAAHCPLPCEEGHTIGQAIERSSSACVSTFCKLRSGVVASKDLHQPLIALQHEPGGEGGGGHRDGDWASDVAGHAFRNGIAYGLDLQTGVRR